MLFGVSITQVCKPYWQATYSSANDAQDLYYVSYPRDFKVIKSTGAWIRVWYILSILQPKIVYTIFAIDIFQSIVVAMTCWHTLCSGWGRPAALTYPGWTFNAVPFISGFGTYYKHCGCSLSLRPEGRNSWCLGPNLLCVENTYPRKMESSTVFNRTGGLLFT